jgi:cation/acetate symporter
MAFSLAASTLFPVLVAAVFWRRANGCGAIAGMLVGFAVCVYYMLHAGAAPDGDAASLWFGIAPISAGVFGVPAGCTALVLASLMTTPPDARIEGFIEQLRQPDA